METVQIVIALMSMAIVTSCAILIISLMRVNEKLKQHVKELEKKLSELQKKQYANLEEIKLLTWKLNNPPKYKKGDKFGDLTVKFCCVHKPSLSEFLANALIGFISICAGYKQENKKSTDLDMYWEYHLSHEHHGDNIKMSESQLTNIKPVEK